MKRIAIIGSGISGLGAAWALKDAADVTLYEKRQRLGGHSHTVQVRGDDGTVYDVDVGFIVYNTRNYPNLAAFFDVLGIGTTPSNMSFAVSDPGGYEWSSTLRGFFAQKRNLFDPAFHRFWRTILRFNNTARRELDTDSIGSVSLQNWLDHHKFDDTFRRNYILPMGAAIWSTPEDQLLDFPAKSFFDFFNNHRLMHRSRPKWRTVAGGSGRYVEAVEKSLGESIRHSAPVAEISPFGNRVKILLKDGRQDVYDDVILATHADQSAALLTDGYAERRFALKSVRFRQNRIYLHRDPALMPRRRAAWASWNVLKQESGEICLTYWMNLLQDIDPNFPLFVTLNPDTPPERNLTFESFSCDHPQFDRAAEAAVRSLKRAQGQNGLWLAGAWMGRGFHEDGLVSGLSAALSLGGRVPWPATGVDILQRADDPAQPWSRPVEATS